MMSSNGYTQLKDELYKGFFENKKYIKTLESLAATIRKKSRRAPNEATVVSEVEISIHDFLKDVFGIDISPIKEMVTPTRARLRGRIDSKIGSVIFEYKHHSKLGTSTLQEQAISQVKDYLEGLALSDSNAKGKYIGIVTDGVKCSVVERSIDGFESTPFQKFSSWHINIIIQNIILSQKVALTADNLVKDLCSNDNNSIASRLTIALYKAIKNGAAEKSKMLLTEWKQLFSLAHDDISKQTAIAKRKAALENITGASFSEVNDEYLALFSLQTAYAIIIKIIAFKIVSKLRLSYVVKFSHYTQYDDSTLAQTMRQIESGVIFREYGLGNLLEGDFFSWYCGQDQWTEEIAKSIRDIYETLSAYEDKPIFEYGENVIDLFKELFMNIIPDDVRHSLGEYYTPMWLADNVVNEAIERLPDARKSSWRGIDPCAGSGTFIVTMIRKVLNETVGLSSQERLKQVLSRVKGIDLNPLAVLSTRINYFINIAPLITEEEYIEIPVYLGDSSYIPEEIEQGGIRALQYTITTTKGPIEILLPASLVVDIENFSIAMTEIEVAIQLQETEGVVEKLYQLLPTKEQNQTALTMIKDFANVLVDFERRKWNGIWARIIANYLTTACLGKFDIIVGNPPWVDWKSLPNNYRDRVKSLCID